MVEGQRQGGERKGVRYPEVRGWQGNRILRLGKAVMSSPVNGLVGLRLNKCNGPGRLENRKKEKGCECGSGSGSGGKERKG